MWMDIGHMVLDDDARRCTTLYSSPEQSPLRKITTFVPSPPTVDLYKSNAQFKYYCSSDTNTQATDHAIAKC